ncbi:MAG: extracellular solute-binding protein [Chloroflexota bacterium]|nr:extracellular solute-binding protein [Chloroflexota bacterium]MDE2841443.1 extracellular solute-binding protein [Chloroflexota bacterium]MDE2931592.1 extracellular solute-binding protein [Chloroflexota bacterium]
MLTRRALIAGSAALTAGCGFLESRFSAPSLPQERPLTWAVTRVFDEELPWLAEQLLNKDEENPNGPKRGGYILSRQEVGKNIYGDELIRVLQEMEADLVNVNTFNVDELAERGVLLPLDGFLGADETTLNQEHYPSVLDQFRVRDSLYALPLNAMPLMMHYDEALFAAQGVPPVDSSWAWADLVRVAEQLTEKKEDGTVRRWGLIAHNFGIWWALWQNNAEVVDPATGECRLGDAAALEALEFMRGLFHTQRVSPAAVRRELGESIYINGVGPAMKHTLFPRPPTGIRLAELPRGKAQVVPVRADMGMAIVAETSRPEVAYMAMRGLVDVMQELVVIPAQREAVARLGDFKVGLEEKDISIVQRSMEHGRGVPRYGQTARRALDRALEALVQGDDVTTAVNDTCRFIRQSQ